MIQARFFFLSFLTEAHSRYHFFVHWMAVAAFMLAPCIVGCSNLVWNIFDHHLQEDSCVKEARCEPCKNAYGCRTNLNSRPHLSILIPRCLCSCAWFDEFAILTTYLAVWDQTASALTCSHVAHRSGNRRGNVTA